MNSRNLIMLGTKKGAFVLESKDGRRVWKAKGPYFRGTPTYHVIYDRRNRLLFAAVDSDVWGPTVERSAGLGRTWKGSRRPPKFSKESDWTVKQMWHIEPGSVDEPEVVYCGTDPAALFKSNDAGMSWSVNEALFNHETRPKWQPGFGGLCLHSILVEPRNPKTMQIAISAVGILKTTDGGLTWSFRNKNLRADFLSQKYPEYGQCPRHMVHHDSMPNVIYQQNHCGAYRSDDGGESWIDISRDLPSRFGFPIAVDSIDPKRIYVTPEESGAARLPIENRFLVWSSDDAGKHWSPLGIGLPKRSFYTVYREGMATDGEDPCGVYVGTSTGQLFGSRNGGRRWELIADALPPIYSVTTGSLQ